VVIPDGIFFCSWLSDTRKSVQWPWLRSWRNLLERDFGLARLQAANMVHFPRIPCYDQDGFRRGTVHD
jgi:hypothetical protein